MKDADVLAAVLGQGILFHLLSPTNSPESGFALLGEKIELVSRLARVLLDIQFSNGLSLKGLEVVVLRPRLRKISKAVSRCGPRVLLLRSRPGVFAVRRCIARSPNGVNGARGVRRFAERRAEGVKVVYRGVIGCMSRAVGIYIKSFRYIPWYFVEHCSSLLSELLNHHCLLTSALDDRGVLESTLC